MPFHVARSRVNLSLLFVAGAWLLGGGATALGQDRPETDIEVLEDAVLEGEPTVRVEASAEAADRIELTATEAASERLQIRVENGQFRWTSRDDTSLLARRVGDFTYLSSADSPGSYIRITRVNDRLSYVEHLETAGGNVTYWGELSIRLGR
jgi:hypothetical protein